MGQCEVTEDRRCRKCREILHVTATGLKEHSATCEAHVKEPVKRIHVALKPYPRQTKKISNRERARLAQGAILQMAEMKVLLLAALAQKGGEITITMGTISQLTDDMTYEVVPCPDDDNAKILRIVK